MNLAKLKFTKLQACWEFLALLKSKCFDETCQIHTNMRCQEFMFKSIFKVKNKMKESLVKCQNHTYICCHLFIIIFKRK